MADTLLMTETELRLGLPGAGDKTHANCGKRGFQETVDLKLNLSSKDRASDPTDFNENHSNADSKTHSVKPPAKAQVVGWPPVRSFRKNVTAVQKRSEAEESAAAAFVKVSMDGAPYLRKVDLKMYKTYQELSDALGKMFGSFTIGKCDTGTQGMLDFMNESKLMDLLNSSDYVPTYEDKDGDWMLVGDVPWEMFVGSCKRLRIMKGTEAKGLDVTIPTILGRSRCYEFGSANSTILKDLTRETHLEQWRNARAESETLKWCSTHNLLR